MSHSLHTVFESADGSLQRCSCCGTIHLQFSILIWHFPPDVFEQFCTFIDSLDVDRMERTNATLPFGRKIMFRLPTTNITVAFTPHELTKLRKILDRGQAVLREEEEEEEEKEKIETEPLELDYIDGLFDEIEEWLVQDIA